MKALALCTASIYNRPTLPCIVHHTICSVGKRASPEGTHEDDGAFNYDCDFSIQFPTLLTNTLLRPSPQSVTECDIGWSWFVSFYAFFALPGVLTAIFTNLLYSTSEFFWLFVFWQFTFIACIVYCCFVASFSTKATRATLIGIMLFFVGYFLPFVIGKYV